MFKLAREPNILVQEPALALTLLCAPPDLLCCLLTKSCVGPCRRKG